MLSMKIQTKSLHRRLTAGRAPQLRLLLLSSASSSPLNAQLPSIQPAIFAPLLLTRGAGIRVFSGATDKSILRRTSIEDEAK